MLSVSFSEEHFITHSYLSSAKPLPDRRNIAMARNKIWSGRIIYLLGHAFGNFWISSFALSLMELLAIRLSSLFVVRHRSWFDKLTTNGGINQGSLVLLRMNHARHHILKIDGVFLWAEEGLRELAGQRSKQSR
jgi:hypothetical protein